MTTWTLSINKLDVTLNSMTHAVVGCRANNELQMQHTVKTPRFCYKVNAAFLYDYPQQTA